MRIFFLIICIVCIISIIRSFLIYRFIKRAIAVAHRKADQAIDNGESWKIHWDQIKSVDKIYNKYLFNYLVWTYDSMFPLYKEEK